LFLIYIKKYATVEEVFVCSRAAARLYLNKHETNAVC